MHEQEWAEAWRRGAKELERLRRVELASFDYSKNVAIVDALLDLGARFAQPRRMSGLVEQQRLFRRLRT